MSRKHKLVTLTHVLVLDNGRVAQALPWLAGTVASQVTAFPGITAGPDSGPAFPLAPAKR